MFGVTFPRILKRTTNELVFLRNWKATTEDDIQCAYERWTKKKTIFINKLLSDRDFSHLNEGRISSIMDEHKKPLKNNKMSYCFAVDITVAEKIGKKILQSMSKKSKIIIEGNPGLGLITNYLLQSKANVIKLVQPKSKMNECLFKILTENNHRVLHENKNILTSNPQMGPFYSKLFTNNAGQLITLVGVVPNQSFFTCLVRLLTKGFLWKDINFECFFVVSENVLHNLTDFSKAKGKFNVHCLFNYFFTIQIMDKFSRDSFAPLSVEHDEYMYLIKVKKNQSSRNKLTDEYFTFYTTYLRVMEKSRYSLIIKVLEKWFPDCGIPLIREGIGYTNQVQDLSADESIVLFNILTKCEGFEHFKTLQPVFESGRLYLQ